MKSQRSNTFHEGDGHRRRAPAPGSWAAVALAVLALVFIFENTQDTDIRVLVPVVTMPLWVALLVVALVGFLVGGYLSHRRRRRRADAGAVHDRPGRGARTSRKR